MDPKNRGKGSKFKGFEDVKRMVKPEALCLPIADLLNNPLASKIVSAIQGINVVSMTAGKLQPINPKKLFRRIGFASISISFVLPIRLFEI